MSTVETTWQSVWSASKTLVKGLLIGLLVLLLLIPSFYVQSLIEEREARQKEAVAEVSARWAGSQNIAGPVLVLPYLKNAADTAKAPQKSYAFFLPDELFLNSALDPQERHRGIYKVMLYSARVDMNGRFLRPDLAKLRIDPSQVLWNEAYITLNLSDPKGLNEELKLKWNDSLLTLAPSTSNLHPDGMEAGVPVGPGSGDVSFSASFGINGSQQLLFTPNGRTTTVRMKGNWPHPSFTGSILPATPASISDSGFTAEWKSMAHRRNFPQQWADAPYAINSYGTTGSRDLTTMIEPAANAAGLYNLGTASFGLDLFVPVNAYQKTLRSVKYAVLCILLTFTAFFLIDTIYRKGVHPLQYGLIGLALILFYALLLSFSEYIGFNWAYAIASVATIALIGWFVKGILSSGRLSLLLSAVLVLVYGYVFSILQLQDYALLFGSIGLFVSLAVIMYFSRRIQW